MTHDIFISYRSNDVTNIRLVAEWLISGGQRVWFAEYNINIDNRERFREEIECALNSCKCFIFFANNEYYLSDFCMHEVQQIKKRKDIWPERVLNISTDMNSLSEPAKVMFAGPEVVHIDPYFTYESVTRKVIKKVSDKLEIVIPVQAPRFDTVPASTMHKTYRIDNVVLKLFIVGWKNNQLSAAVLLNKFCLDEYVYFLGDIPIVLRLYTKIIGEEEKFNPKDDRELFEQYVRLLREKMRGEKLECVGIHLIHLFGRSHIAATFKVKEDVWNRSYAVFLAKNKRNNDQLYLEMQFMVNGSFEDFCKVARYMDDLVYCMEIKLK